MDYQPIGRPPAEQMWVTPNLIDYNSARRAVLWKEVRAQLDGLPDGDMRILEEGPGGVRRSACRVQWGTGGERMAFKGEAYDEERFWEQVRSESPSFLGFWTHR